MEPEAGDPRDAARRPDRARCPSGTFARYFLLVARDRATGTIRGVRDGRVLVNPAYAPDLCVVYLSHIFMLPEARGTVLTYWLRIAPVDLAVSYLHTLHQRGKIALPAPDAPGQLLRHAHRPRRRDGVLHPRGPALAAAHPLLRPRRLRRHRPAPLPVPPARLPRPGGDRARPATGRCPFMLLLRRVGREREARLPIDEARAVMQLLYDDFADLLRADAPRQQPRRRARPARGAPREGQERRGAAAAARPAPHDLKRLQAALPLRRLPALLRAGPGDRRVPAGRRRRDGRREPALARRASSRAIAGGAREDAALRLREPRQGLRPRGPRRSRPRPASGSARVSRSRTHRPVISVEHVSKRFGDFVAVRRRRASRSAAASSSRCSAPRAAARRRCCA